MNTNYSDEIQKLGRAVRLQTLDEIRDYRVKVETRAGEVTVQETADGVTVTVAVDSAPSTKMLGRNLYTEDEVDQHKNRITELALPGQIGRWVTQAEMALAKSRVDLAEARKELRSKEAMIESLEGHLKSIAREVSVDRPCIKEVLSEGPAPAVLSRVIRQVQRISQPWSTSDPSTEETSQA